MCIVFILTCLLLWLVSHVLPPVSSSLVTCMCVYLVSLSFAVPDLLQVLGFPQASEFYGASFLLYIYTITFN